MALQSPFFGKRDADSLTPRNNAALGAHRPPTATPAATTTAATINPQAPAPSAQTSPTATTAGTRPGADSQLKVGPLIRLKGVEITDCDTLFVEGTVEATMDSRVMEIAAPGCFKGAAVIDIAEIHGRFEGTLTARDRLVIHPTGQVSGTVRYGKLSIAEGGQLSGDVGLLDTTSARVANPAS